MFRGQNRPCRTRKDMRYAANQIYDSAYGTNMGSTVVRRDHFDPVVLVETLQSLKADIPQLVQILISIEESLTLDQTAWDSPEEWDDMNDEKAPP